MAQLQEDVMKHLIIFDVIGVGLLDRVCKN